MPLSLAGSLLFKLMHCLRAADQLTTSHSRLRRDVRFVLRSSDRAAAVRTPVNGGTFAKLSRAAYSRQTTFRSVTANHLVSQVPGLRPAADAARELAAAFVLGCAISYDRHRRPPAEPAAIPIPLVPLETAETIAIKVAKEVATSRLEVLEREVAAWQADYDAALAAARLRLGNPTWQPRCPQQIGVRPRPLPGFPLAVGG